MLKNFNFLFYILTLLVFISSCTSPPRSFDKTKIPHAPDYSMDKYWSALPEKKDSADLTIRQANIIDQQKNASIDVFYVHPTTYLYGRRWNASLSNKQVNKITDKHAVRNQASVFNETCKVYAPRYRQAIIKSYLPKNQKSGDGPKAFEVAYSDIKAAFTYYLKNYNHGRPFVLASHSQGTDHTRRLLHDFFENDSTLRKQLVVAYIVGIPFKKGSVKAIPPCDSANQTGCYVTWNTVPWDENSMYGVTFDSLECVNPLTWCRDTTCAPPSLHKGGLPQTFNKTDAELSDAKISSTGLLWLHRPEVSAKNYPTINSQRFHILDYNLFYMNIRENVRYRVENYLQVQKRR